MGQGVSLAATVPALPSLSRPLAGFGLVAVNPAGRCLLAGAEMFSTATIQTALLWLAPPPSPPLTPELLSSAAGQSLTWWQREWAGQEARPQAPPGWRQAGAPLAPGLAPEPVLAWLLPWPWSCPRPWTQENEHNPCVPQSRGPRSPVTPFPGCSSSRAMAETRSQVLSCFVP